MDVRFARIVGALSLAAALTTTTACSGGGGGDTTSPPTGGNPTPTPSPLPTASGIDRVDTDEDAARLLTQATFGPTSREVSALTGASRSSWLKQQFQRAQTLHVPGILARVEAAEAAGDDEYRPIHLDSFWRAAIEEDDQLRQRMAFALSQIMVISDSNTLGGWHVVLADYMDIMGEHAFGNYRDLLEAVTYSPAMARYLTYLNNRKANERTGRMPDENYAREVMQLFSIGLNELNMDGTLKTGPDGQPIETYTNDDVRGLAKVFTGLSFKGPDFWGWYENRDDDADYSRLQMFDEQHSEEEKSFLGVTIPANTSGEESISIALDTLANHPNTAPFISRQLIQRFVTSHPTPDYVERVATAIANGRYTLPDGDTVGDGRRGDLSATLAAILMDDEARNAGDEANTFGRIREPVLRFLHWARAMGVTEGDVISDDDEETVWQLLWGNGANLLGQLPYRSPSVFNFYRPGYIAPGTTTGEAGLNAPELQIINATSLVGFSDTMLSFQRGQAGLSSGDFVPNVTVETSLADTPDELVERLDLLLTQGRMDSETRNRIIDVLNEIPIREDNPNSEDQDEEANDRRVRVDVAVAMVLNSPEFFVQR